MKLWPALLLLSACGTVVATAPTSGPPLPSREGWYFTVTPPTGDGPAFNVGPWPTQGQCQDTLGSAIYHHPLACHITGPHPPVNCRILGNGFAYPEAWPFPPVQQIVSPQGCFSAPRDKAMDLPAGNYFLFYGPGSSQAMREGGGRYKAAQAKAHADPRYQIGYYANAKCPGAPFFAVGADNACN